MHNHMISAEVRHASFEAVKGAADYTNTAIITAGINVRGVTPRTGVETAPSRGESLKASTSAKDLLMKLNAETTFAWCERALEAWTEDRSCNVGSLHKNSKQLVHVLGNCRLAKINILSDISHDLGADGQQRQEDVHGEPEEAKDDELGVMIPPA